MANDSNYEPRQSKGRARTAFWLSLLAGLALGAIALLVSRARRRRTLAERSREVAREAAKESVERARAQMDRARGPFGRLGRRTRATLTRTRGG
jgi:hypothetical protein